MDWSGEKQGDSSEETENVPLLHESLKVHLPLSGSVESCFVLVCLVLFWGVMRMGKKTLVRILKTTLIIIIQLQIHFSFLEIKFQAVWTSLVSLYCSPMTLLFVSVPTRLELMVAPPKLPELLI